MFDESSGTGSSFPRRTRLRMYCQFNKSYKTNLDATVIIDFDRSTSYIFFQGEQWKIRDILLYVSCIFGYECVDNKSGKIERNENNTCFTAMLPDGTEQKFTGV